MGKFIDSPPTIREIKTEIKARGDGYQDLYLTIKTGTRKITKYIIHNDKNYNIEYVKNKIDNKLDSEDLQISEYKERFYLYIRIGNTKIDVSGRKL